MRAALAQRLGAGWTLTAAGVGESQPLASEAPGDLARPEADAQVDAARRLNRSVRITTG